MSVDEIVSDEGVSGGVSYADRNLGKILLPKTKEGDMIIVSEVSRLGRSMYDLSKLIHDELKPRKLRLVVAGMGIDLNCSKITPIDQLILSNFSFAAELEKHLIRERTLSALQVKRQQGVKFGAASEKYKETYYSKTYLERREFGKKRGATKSCRYKQSRDVVAFLRILKTVFPSACTTEDAAGWDWSQINSKGDNKNRILSLISDYKSIDESGTLFCKWEIDKWDDTKKQVRLCSTIGNIRKSFLNQKKDDVI